MPKIRTPLQGLRGLDTPSPFTSFGFVSQGVQELVLFLSHQRVKLAVPKGKGAGKGHRARALVNV